MQRILSTIDQTKMPYLKYFNAEVEIQDYSSLLLDLGLEYSPYEYYWQVGQINSVQGWIIHLSVVKTELVELLQVVIPIFLQEKIPFKIARNIDTVADLLSGALGYKNIGKLVSAYPDNDISLLLVQKLIAATRQFRGPAIPTDLALGGIVYTRYGSFSPILKKDALGEYEKYIYNAQGNLIPDPNSVPFVVPDGIIFPFHSIVSPMIAKPGKLLNSAYYPVKTLKNDAKGLVIKGLYFRRPWQIKPCILKQGHRNMCTDDQGRDMHDRLMWQAQLQKELSDEFPIPRIIDQFHQGETLFLVMEYINGITLTEWLNNIYKKGNWRNLSHTSQLRSIDFLTNILSMVKKLHQKGIIHRDLTTENFLITKDDRIFMIDVELAWSFRYKIPSPPFGLGTPGYMSPEQEKMSIPTVKEDIYTLGIFMIALFTNLLPLQLPLSENDKLIDSLLFFIEDEQLVKIISKCVQYDPNERPSLQDLIEDVQEATKKYKVNLVHRIPPQIKQVDPVSVRSGIQAGLNGLVNPQMLSANGLWVSRKQRIEENIGNEQHEMSLYTGWYTGISGPLWLLARARLAGFDIETCRPAYYRNLNYITSGKYAGDYLDNSLGRGQSGIALAISEGLNSRLLSPDQANLSKLRSCFSTQEMTLSLLYGVAGQGIALLRATNWLDEKFASKILKSYITTVIEKQRRDGTWGLFDQNSNPKIQNITLANGDPGIVWFLLACLKYDSECEVRLAVKKALSFLLKTVKASTKPKSRGNISYTSVILVLLKACEVLREGIYLEMLKPMLNSIPLNRTRFDFSLDSGLARQGELNLEAYSLTGDELCKKRADWIAGTFIHTLKANGMDSAYWLPQKNTTSTADLSVGNSGILHFLMRYHGNCSLSHPLWPFNNS